MWRYFTNVSKPVVVESDSTTEQETISEEIRLRKRSNNSNKKYDEESRAKIAKWAIENGNISAVKKFDMPESTVRNFKKKYQKAVSLQPINAPGPSAIGIEKQGKPLKLGSLDKVVQK